MPSSSIGSSKPTVFLSYSHRDEKWKDRLLAHLRVLEREGHLEVWDDHQIAAGEDWRREIRAALERARVAVLLLSADFLSSDFIRREEVPRLLARRETEGVRVIPVIVRSCPWESVLPVSALLARPRQGKPLADFRGNGRDRALTEIALEIQTLLAADSGEAPAKAPPPLPRARPAAVRGLVPPDKRHLFYEACIENRLTAALPRRGEPGTPPSVEPWRPDDREERIRRVAALAAALQEEGFRSTAPAPPVAELAKHLPAVWDETQRQGFLAWLAGPAALLQERADGALAFAHPGLPEFLTAWHLHATVEGANARIEAFRSRLAHRSWWETLRLWAALIERGNPDRLEPILAALQGDRGPGLFWVGTALADGVGSEARFASWLQAFLAALDPGAWSAPREWCAESWAASRQTARRRRLQQELRQRAHPKTWLGWMRLRELFPLAALGRPPLPPPHSVPRALLATLRGRGAPSALGVAAGRIFCGAVPLWPVAPRELGLLQVWPSHRRLVGLRLQLAANCGAGRAELATILRATAGLPVAADEHARPLARRLLDELVDLTSGPIRELAFDLAPDLARYLVRYLPRDLPFDVILDQALDLAQAIARDLADPDRARARVRDVADGRVRDSRRPRCPMVSPCALELPADAEWAPLFRRFEILSFGRAAARILLSREGGESDLPAARLLAPACRLSLHPRAEAAGFEEALGEEGRRLSPLWPTLARHLARRCEPGDRELLEDLARHPEKAPAPLSWGLQFIVRGDVVLLDGTEIPLDALTDEAGLPRLPYLEELPDELEMDW